jgi:plastocyanin
MRLNQPFEPHHDKRSRTMKHSLAVLAAGIAAAAFTGQAAAASSITITIHHQKAGCHAWAIGTGAYKVVQTLTVKPGTTLTFTDNDVMGHTLVQLVGPKVALVGRNMDKMGAHAKVVLSKPGSYVFGTKEGNDYYKGVVTTGPDNILRLVVTVK